MQVSGRITEIVLRTDDKETGVKISFSLDQEQELELARLRGQALTFNIVPREQLKQGSLFEATAPDKILKVDFGSGPQHPWQPTYIEVVSEDGERTDKLVCGYDGCTQPQEKHTPMRDLHFYRPLSPEQLKDLAEVPDYCADCTLPARFHYQRPDHTYVESNEPGPSGEMISHCAVEGCEVPAALHMRDLDAVDEPNEDEEDGTSLAGNAYHSLPEVSDEVIHEERDLTDVPIVDLPSDAAPEAAASPAVAEVDPRFADYPNRPHTASDAAAEEGMRRRGRGRQSRGSDAPESEASTFETEERPE